MKSLTCRVLRHQKQYLRTLSQQDNTWVKLEAYLPTNEESFTAWKKLKLTHNQIQKIIHKHLTPRLEGRPPAGINWKEWQNKIKHRGIVDCLKHVYDEHIAIIDRIVARQSVQQEDTGDRKIESYWGAYEDAVRSCKENVELSEAIVADGERALWVSFKNPLATSIPTEEWLDSDLYWQAYLERHHHFDSSKDTDACRILPQGTFEDDKQDETCKQIWHKHMNLFHNRSDTPILYSYMDQLHSSDYYDLHRRIFFEHMLYHLIRTGHSFHFFPEIPPAQWLDELEQYKYYYLMRAHQRRVKRQLTTLNLHEPLDLSLKYFDDPEYIEHHFMNLANEERITWDYIVSQLMTDFIFLCHPAIPCQSTVQLENAMRIDHGKGRIYALSEDVAAVFYIPEGVFHPLLNETSATWPRLPRPNVALNTWLTYAKISGQNINAGYVDLLYIYADILEKRGDYWFCAPNECIVDTFLRKLRPDDPYRPIFIDYAQQLKTQWTRHASIITLEAAARKLFDFQPTIEETKNTIYKIRDLEFFTAVQPSSSSIPVA